MATTPKKSAGAAPSKKPIVKQAAKIIKGLTPKQLEIKLSSAKNQVEKLQAQLDKTRQLVADLRAKNAAKRAAKKKR